MCAIFCEKAGDFIGTQGFASGLAGQSARLKLDVSRVKEVAQVDVCGAVAS